MTVFLNRLLEPVSTLIENFFVSRCHRANLGHMHSFHWAHTTGEFQLSANEFEVHFVSSHNEDNEKIAFKLDIKLMATAATEVIIRILFGKLLFFLC